MPWTNQARALDPEHIDTPYLSIRFGLTTITYTGGTTANQDVALPLTPDATQTVILVTHQGTGSFWTSAYRLNPSTIRITAQYIAGLTGTFPFSWMAIDIP